MPRPPLRRAAHLKRAQYQLPQIDRANTENNNNSSSSSGSGSAFGAPNSPGEAIAAPNTGQDAGIVALVGAHSVVAAGLATGQAVNADSSQQTGFLDLAPELRNEIYGYYLDDTFSSIPPLLKTCRIVKQEAEGMFYAKSKLVIRGKGPADFQQPINSIPWARWLSRLRPEWCSSLTSVDIVQAFGFVDQNLPQKFAFAHGTGTYGTPRPDFESTFNVISSKIQVFVSSLPLRRGVIRIWEPSQALLLTHQPWWRPGHPHSPFSQETYDLLSIRRWLHGVWDESVVWTSGFDVEMHRARGYYFAFDRSQWPRSV